MYTDVIAATQPFNLAVPWGDADITGVFPTLVLYCVLFYGALAHPFVYNLSMKRCCTLSLVSVRKLCVRVRLLLVASKVVKLGPHKKPCLT